uniref:CSON003219 protein n=1 Tax=Culicoides sonorensis TaxID=179676 RepID=A0A336LSJ9_CULSO
MILLLKLKAFKSLIAFIVIILVNKLIVNGQNSQEMSFAVIYDPQQVSVIDMVSEVMKQIETEYGGNLKLVDKLIVNNKEDVETQFCQVLESGVSAVLDLTHSELASDPGPIPYFHLDVTIQTFAEAMELYITSRNGLDTIFIVQNEEEMDGMLYHIIQKSKLRVLVIDGLDDSKLRKLSKVRPVPSHFSLIGNTKNLMSWFEMIKEARMIKIPNKWQFLFTDFQYDNFKYHTDFPDISRLVIDKNVCCKHLKVNGGRCDCPTNFDLAESHLKNFLKSIIPVLQNGNHIDVKYDCNQLLLNNSPSDSDNNNAILSSSIYSNVISNNPLIFIDATNNMTLRFSYDMQVFTGWEQDGGDHVKVATISNAKLRVDSKMGVKPTKRYFRVGIVEAAPWSYMVRDSKGKVILDDDGQPMWDGYCIEFAKKLAERMDYDFEWVVPKTGKFGKKFSDGQWDGLIGDLYYGDTDVAVAPLKMTAQREEVIDFVTPFYEQTGILIMMRNPVVETSLFKFMTVLRLEVWLSIIAALVATSLMLWLLDTYSPYSSRNNKKAYPFPCREFTLKESFWFTLTSFTPQGGGEAPKSLSARTLVAVYWLFVVLMLATFTANLAAFLTVERMKTPVQSLDQLARQSRINYTVVEGSDVHQFFINMKFAEDTLYRMWKEITLNSSSDDLQYRVWEYPIKEQYGNILLAINDSMPVKTPEEGYRKVNEAVNADFAFIHDAAEIKYQIARNCNFTQVGEIFAEQPYALAIQQGSHLHDEFSKSIIELQHERFFELLTAKYWNNSLKGYCPNSDESEGITLDSLGGVFIATLFGLGLAMITLVGEVFYHKRRAQKTPPILQVKPMDGDSVGLSTPPTISGKIHPSPPTYAETLQRYSQGDDEKGNVTIGGNTFMPVNKKQNFNSLFRAGGNVDMLE